MAITVESARTIGMIAVIGFGGLALASAILLTSVAKKFALLAIFGLLALLAWTQRSALDTCLDVLRDADTAETGCEFFGFEVGLGD